LVVDQSVGSLAIDTTDVYYGSENSIWRVSKEGGPPSEVASGLVQPAKIDLASSVVVVLDYRRRIVAVDKTGGAFTVLWEDGDPFARFWDIAVNEKYVAVLRTVGDLDGSIVSVPLVGGEPTVLANTDVGCWPQLGHGIALSPTHAYWGEGVSIKRVALGGGVVETVCDTDNHAHALAVGTNLVYWAEGAGGLSFGPLEGGSKTSVAGGGIAEELAVDSGHVYWTSGSTLLRSTFGTSISQVFQNGISQLSDLAVDESHVYYGSASPTGMSVAKVAK